MKLDQYNFSTNLRKKIYLQFDAVTPMRQCGEIRETMTCEDDLRTAPSMHQQQDTPTPSSIPTPGAGKGSRHPPTRDSSSK